MCPDPKGGPGLVGGGVCKRVRPESRLVGSLVSPPEASRPRPPSTRHLRPRPPSSNVDGREGAKEERSVTRFFSFENTNPQKQ